MPENHNVFDLQRKKWMNDHLEMSETQTIELVQDLQSKIYKLSQEFRKAVREEHLALSEKSYLASPSIIVGSALLRLAVEEYLNLGEENPEFGRLPHSEIKDLGMDIFGMTYDRAVKDQRESAELGMKMFYDMLRKSGLTKAVETAAVAEKVRSDKQEAKSGMGIVGVDP